MQRARDREARLLTPKQLGVDVCAGMEAIVHTVQRIFTELGDDNRLGLLLIDLRNDFNLVSLRAFLSATRRHLPDLYPWIHYCYGTDAAPWLSNSNHKCRSCTGVQECNPLVTLLFSLSLNGALADLKKFLDDSSPPSANSGVPHSLPHLSFLYLDDGSFIGSHSTLRSSL